MPIIGVAGKYCSGKNVVTEILEEKGYVSIDVDKLGHQALLDEQSALVETFGNRVLTPEGTIDRKKLGTIVFNDREMLRKLESIVHPRMVLKVREKIEDLQKNGSDRVVINAAILFSMKLHVVCDFVLWVEAPIIKRMKRAKKRDNLTVFHVLKRFWSQRTLTPQSSDGGVDIYTIKNSGKIDCLRTRVEEILSKEEAG